ncbi:MAG: sulfur oxidation c-type cytochrome SoxA [Rubrimonas sp.]
MKQNRAALIAVSLIVIAGPAAPEPVDDTLEIDGVVIVTRATAAEGLPYREVLSGWHYREAETRALQADSFANPGMLAVERGAEIWETAEGPEGRSCAGCHGDASESMKTVGARYPTWSDSAGKPRNVELQIDACRTENLKVEAYPFDHPDQIALTAFIKHQAMGSTVQLDLDRGGMRDWWRRGEELYYTRHGQLNLACANCHEDNNGRYIRADHLSQGNVNGFPTFRLRDGMVSLNNRLRGCFRDVRAEFPEAFRTIFWRWRSTPHGGAQAFPWRRRPSGSRAANRLTAFSRRVARRGGHGPPQMKRVCSCRSIDENSSRPVWGPRP